MKILLAAVNAKYIHSNPAVYSLKAFAEKNGSPEITVREFTINEPRDKILARIRDEHPDFLGLSVYIWNVTTVRSLIPEIRKLFPGVMIWLGGPEASCRAGEMLTDFPEVTGIVIGEGEKSFSELVCSLEKGQNDLSKIPGILFRDESHVSDEGRKESHDREEKTGLSEFVQTSPAVLTDLTEIPFLYDDLTPFKNRILYYESGRGCPFRCAYCLSSIDKALRFRNPETVKKELQFFLDNQVKQVKFVDRTFNCKKEHAMEIWRYLKEHDNGITNFHFELEAEILTDEEIELITSMRPGQLRIEIGIQSTHKETLLAVNRESDWKKLSSIVGRIIRAGNTIVHLDLIAGLPFEDYERFAQSFNDVYALYPDELQLGFLKILYGTPLAEKTEEFGMTCCSFPPYEILSTKWLSETDIRKLKQIEYVLDLYYNSRQYVSVLPVLEPFFKNPFSLYESLASFFEANHLFAVTPSRFERYESLLSFSRKHCPADAVTEIRRKLTQDYNSREVKRNRRYF